MVGLLDRLRLLRAEGQPVQVFSFDVDHAGSSIEREVGMTETLAAHARQHPEALTMVLVGELHASKAQGNPWDHEYLPMAKRLVDEGVSVWSLGRATPAGTVWSCTGPTPGDCKEGTVRAHGSLPSGQAKGIELYGEGVTGGFDGLYATTTLTASPPANQVATR